jgi:hypothetical protein
VIGFDLGLSLRAISIRRFKNDLAIAISTSEIAPIQRVQLYLKVKGGFRSRSIKCAIVGRQQHSERHSKITGQRSDRRFATATLKIQLCSSESNRCSMTKADDFRSELQAQWRQADMIGRAFIDVTSADLCRAVGDYSDVASTDLYHAVSDYPDPQRHRIKTCCDVMQQARKHRDQVLAAPPLGNGATLTIRYYLPR